MQATALAGPTGPDATPPDPDGAPRASSPWIDLAPSHVLEQHAADVVEPNENHRTRAALELGSFYAGFSVWAYFAWYRHHPPLSNYKFGGDGMLNRFAMTAAATNVSGNAWAALIVVAAI